MRYYGSWYGGPNYRAGDTREIFDSIADAKRALEQRHSQGHLYPQPFGHTDGHGNIVEITRALTPCVDETSDIYLYAADSAQYEESGWDYPTYRVFFGPRGGVRHERV